MRIGFVAALIAVPALAAPNPAPVLEADLAFAALSRAQGPRAAFDAYLAPDAVAISEGRLLDGKAPFLAEFEAAPAGFALDWTPKGGAISDDGTLGTTWGEWTRSVPAKDGTLAKTHGVYFTAWRKQRDGRWLAIADGGSPRSEGR